MLQVGTIHQQLWYQCVQQLHAGTCMALPVMSSLQAIDQLQIVFVDHDHGHCSHPDHTMHQKSQSLHNSFPSCAFMTCDW
jgi:hypothetical protein